MVVSKPIEVERFSGRRTADMVVLQPTVRNLLDVLSRAYRTPDTMVSNHDGSIFDIGGNISKVTDTGF